MTTATSLTARLRARRARRFALRDEIAEQYGYAVLPRVGAAGGIGTPAAVAAAFSAGAAYVLTGSVNQSALESGLSDRKSVV